MKADTQISLSDLKAQLASYDEQIADLTAKREQVSAAIEERASKKSTALERVLAVMTEYNIEIDDLKLAAPATAGDASKADQEKQPTTPARATKKTAAKTSTKSPARKTTKGAAKKAASKKAPAKSAKSTQKSEKETSASGDSKDQSTGSTFPATEVASNHPAGIGTEQNDSSQASTRWPFAKLDTQVPPTNAPESSKPAASEHAPARAVIYEELPEPAPSAEDED